MEPKACPFGEGDSKVVVKANGSGSSPTLVERQNAIRRRYIGPFTDAQRDSIY